ncbi:uncharacterized protein LOC123873438 [Maniola jurtina]|uniref:uncharacterized protein LOC123873438 n=1 Tax=Maniola jurtina TaxID=191418 RepID=UPI001E68E024|nr:uncharacterized protein LOC123873438 [Maniola jurtina]
MQANYPNKLPRTFWDPVHLNYPVRKFPETGISSEAIGRYWKSPPDVLHEVKTPIEEALGYCRDYNVTNALSRPQTAVDYGYKIPEAERINKHTPCYENLYIYPPSRKLADRTPALTAHGTTEMKSSYAVPTVASRLVTDKNQFKHPASLPQVPPAVEPFIEELEPLDTTHDGFEKHLDPYLTTSRLHHRPFTADQLARTSNTKDVVTYYTYANIPWVRSPKPNSQDYRLPLSKAKSVYDREKFKQGFREIRTHNKPNWVPRTFRTEVRDNYVEQTSRPESQIHNFEEELMLTVYYESKCPDSKSFILKQLEPTMQQLHEFITLKFVPFGKSRSINYGDGGFECQHGSAECLGNVVQDCSLHFLNEKSDREKLAYVACEMDTTAGSQGKFDCVEKANLSKAEVEDCVVSGKGTVLQLESEYYTNLVKPKFVPTVTVNGIFDQEFQDKAQNDLFGACCSLIPEAAPCAQYYNYLALNHLMYEPYVQ